MKFVNVFVAAMLAMTMGNAAAEQLATGVWLQTSSTAGDCADCEITVTRITPQIIQIASNNGWTGYAHYVFKDDRYEGAFQWNAGAGGDYQNVVFLVDLTYERQTLTFKAKSDPLSFSSTYRKK